MLARNSFNIRKALITASLATALLASAVGQQVTTDYDRKANFQHYRTFSIYKIQASNPLVEQRLHDGLIKDLAARGLEMVPQGGELAITAIGSRKNQQEYDSFYQGLGGGGFGWRGRGFGGFGGGFGNEGIASTQVINIPVGTLVVDVYDGSNHQLLFRGVASDTLSTKEDKNSKKLQKAIDKIFDKFPSKNVN